MTTGMTGIAKGAQCAVMRVCTTGAEGSGSDLGAGGSGNEASGGEMEYDGRVAGIGVSAGKEGDMGRSG
jgi:hypothetical protein